MKNSYQIGNTLNIAYSTITRYIKKIGLIPIASKGNIHYYDDFQISLLIEKLENKGLINNEHRTISEIAKITNSDYETIFRIIQRENIIAIKLNPLRYNSNQQDLIFNSLYYQKKLDFITLPSKLNNPTPEYSRKDFIEKGLIC